MKNGFAFLKEKRTLTWLFVICLAILFYVLLENLTGVRQTVGALFSVLAPLIGGAVLAYLLDPFARWVEKHPFGKWKRRRAARILAAVIVFILVLSIIVVLLVSLVPELIGSLGLLLENIRYYFANAEETVTSLVARYPVFDISVEEIMPVLRSWVDSAVTLLTENLDTIIQKSYQAGGKVFNVVLAIVFSLYILLDKENILRSVRRWAKSRMDAKAYDRWHGLIMRGNRIFTGFLGGNVLDSLIIGVTNFIVMKIFSMPYALLISAVVGVTNFIPTFGPIIGAVPSALILLLIEPFSALEFIIITVILQTLDPYLLKPLLFGDVTGLRPLWVLAAVIIGGRLFGFWGMIFGIPLLAVVSQMLNEGVDKRLAQRGLDAEGLPVMMEEPSAEAD